MTQQIAGWLRQAGIDANFVGQAVTAWSADIADGNYQLTQHWSQTSVSPYQLYNDWLNGAQATSNAAGDFERLKDPQVDAMLSKLAADNSVSLSRPTSPRSSSTWRTTCRSSRPSTASCSTNTTRASSPAGRPTSNPYESGSPNTPTNEVVVLHLKPTG